MTKKQQVLETISWCWGASRQQISADLHTMGHEIPKPSFRRILRELVAEGTVVRKSDGLYYRA